MIGRLFFTGLLAVLGFAAAVFFQVLPVPFQSSNDLACEINERLADYRASQSQVEDGRIQVMMLRLQGDNATNDARGVFIDSVRGPYGDKLVLTESCRSLQATASDPATLHQAAKEILGNRDADMLIYGRYNAAENLYGLRLSAGTKTGSSLTGYRAEEFVVEEAFINDFAAAFTAEILTQAKTIDKSGGRATAAALEPIAHDLKEALTRFNDQDTPHLRNMRQTYRNVLFVLGTQSGDRDWLEESIAFERAETAAGRGGRSGSTFERWLSNTSLASSLKQLAMRNRDETLLEEAIAAERIAAEVYDINSSAYKWAMTLNNLGYSLQTLANWRDDEAMLEEAIATYREALKGWTQERYPLDWALVQNNLGNALGDLAFVRNDTSLNEEAIAAYQLALTEWTRESSPLNWAKTQNNLGNSLHILGLSLQDEALIEEAIRAFRQSLLERRRAYVPLDWAQTQSNLGLTLTDLGIIRQDKEMIGEGESALRLSLMERTRDRVPFDWARTTTLLGITVGSLAALDRDLQRALEAADLFQQAQDVFVTLDEQSMANWSGYWLTAVENLIAELEAADNTAQAVDAAALPLNVGVQTFADSCGHEDACPHFGRWRDSSPFRTQP